MHFLLHFRNLRAMNNKFETLVEALNDLKKRGFEIDFEMTQKGLLKDVNDHFILEPEDCEIVEYHRFEGMSSPDDNSIVYAIQTDSGLKGTVVDAYGAEGSYKLAHFLNEIT